MLVRNRGGRIALCPMKSRPRASSSLARALLALGLAAVAHTAHAQLTVTGINYGTGTNGNQTYEDGLWYSNRYVPVTSVNTSGGLYLFNGPVANSIQFRWSSTSAQDPTLFYQYGREAVPNWWGGTSNQDVALGKPANSLQDVFLSGNLYTGIRNPFANVDSSNSSLATGIERIDFYMNSYTVQAGDALTFFDLENTNNFGDGFRIAVFTQTSATDSTPTVYTGPGLLVQPDSFGPAVNSPTGGTDGDFWRATYDNGTNLNNEPDLANLGDGLNLVGIVIRFSDLGIAPGTVIQGFSLMAGDVAVTDANSLVNWNNTSVYRNNTNADSWGNMDFMGFGAQVARPIPEPETYGLLAAGAGLGFLAWRRRRAVTRAAVRA